MNRQVRRLIAPVVVASSVFLAKPVLADRHTESAPSHQTRYPVSEESFLVNALDLLLTANTRYYFSVRALVMDLVEKYSKETNPEKKIAMNDIVVACSGLNISPTYASIFYELFTSDSGDALFKAGRGFHVEAMPQEGRSRSDKRAIVMLKAAAENLIRIHNESPEAEVRIVLDGIYQDRSGWVFVTTHTEPKRQ
jgi:hypothetical protein